MILYNTLMGICAALILFTSAGALRHYGMGSSLLGHGVALLVAGIPLTVLGFAMTLTWPLNVNPPINIAFGEPSLLLGVFALVGGFGILRGYHERADFSIKPVAWAVFALGLILTAISAAILRFNLVGDAPAAEPITGQFQGWENTTFALVYLLGAVGCLMLPKVENYWVYKVVRFSWIGTGVFFLAFSVLNYYTHIGMLTNLGTGSDYKW
jgi:hypothetical protein